MSRTANIKTDYSNLAPRVGFSATLPQRMVLRGGYGLSYFPGNYMSQSFLKSAPFTSTYGPVISAAASGGVPNIFTRHGVPAAGAHTTSRADRDVPGGEPRLQEHAHRSNTTCSSKRKSPATSSAAATSGGIRIT